MKSQIKLLLLSILLFLACNDVRNGRNSLISVSDISVSDVAMMDSAVPQRSSNNYSKAQIGIFNSNKKFIKDAHLRYHAGNIDSAVSATKKLLISFDGYISNEKESIRRNQIETFLSLRVPSNNFESFIDSLTLITGSYESKSINLKDVTEEYIDTETRLENKRQVERKYLDLLNKAKKVEDLLAIEQNLGKVREEIESAEKRMMILQRDIDYSTINVQFYRIDESISSRYNYNMFYRIINSLKRGWNGIIISILFIISAWPIIILLFLLYYFMRKYIRRRKVKNTNTV